MRRPAGGVAAVMVMALFASGCGGTTLAEDDPRGQEACDQLNQALRHLDDFDQYAGNLSLASQAAAHAKTKAIADTVVPTEGLAVLPTVHAKDLHAACEDADVEMRKLE